MKILVCNYIEAVYNLADYMIRSGEDSKKITAKIKRILTSYDRKQVLKELHRRNQQVKQRLFYTGHFGDESPIWDEIYRHRLYLAFREIMLDYEGDATFYFESAKSIRKCHFDWFV